MSIPLLDIDDKVCQHVDLALLEEIYPKETILRCVEQSESWASKRRRVRKTTALALVWLLIAMALWNHLSQALVWQKLIGKLSSMHPDGRQGRLSASAISGRRQALGSACLQALMAQCCHVLAHKQTMPTAFFGRYRIMAIDSTLFNTADTASNEQAFGRSSNQYGPGAYPQVRCVLSSECGSHAVVGMEIGGYDESEVHGAHQLLAQMPAETLVMVDAGITSGGLFEQARQQGIHVLGALDSRAWTHPVRPRRLSDGSVVAWIAPSSNSEQKKLCYPVRHGFWVRIISYRFTDPRLGEEGQVYRLATTLLNPIQAPARELIGHYHERWEIELVIDEVKTHEQIQRRVLRSKTADGVRQELYGLVLAHYLVRAFMASAAVSQQQDPDRLSFTTGLFQVCEMIDLSLVLGPEAVPYLLTRLPEKLTFPLLPVRRLRINPREIKQVSRKYDLRKRHRPAPIPFEPQERFLDFVEVYDPLPSPIVGTKGA